MSESDLRQDLSQVFAELEALRRDNSYLRMKIRYLESGGGRDKVCKVSKWTKVKGALGWEKEKEDLLLKVPNSSSDPSSSISVSPAGSCLSHSSLGAQFNRSRLHSSSSSEEDIHSEAIARRSSSINKGNGYKIEEGRRSKSLDGETAKALEEHIANKKLENKEIQKSYKTPWSKVKGIIHNTKGVRKRSQEEKRDKMIFLQGHEHQLSGDEDSDMAKLNTPKLTLTLPSNEELCTEPNKKRQEPNNKETNPGLSPQMSRKSKWSKVRSVFLQGSRSAPASPIRLDSFLYDIESDEISSGEILEEKEDEVFHENDDIRYEIELGYAQLQSKLTDEFSKKMESIAERKRAESRDQNRERDLSPEFKKKLEEWDRIKQGKEPAKKLDKDKEKNKSKNNERTKKKCSRQEVLIPTSTGMFRFEGISDKFTRRLYEWEQARGITPEESTFVLLDPEYKPSFSHSQGENGILVRSKSIGSISGPTNNQLLVQQPSSLSLNDMDDFQACSGNLMDFEEVGTSDMEATGQRDVFGYAPEEVTRLIDSSSGESDKGANHQQVVNSSYQLLQGNITLLDKLKKEREACRQLEDDMRLLEGQIYNVSKSFDQDRLKSSVDNLDVYDYDPEILSENLRLIRDSENNRILDPVSDFTVKFDDFKRVETTMVDEEMSQDFIPYNHGYIPYEREEATIHDIFRELMDMADQLESAVVERDKEMLHIKSALFRKQMESSESSFSTFTLPMHCLRGRRSQDLSRLPKQIMDKILELKHLINSTSSTSDLILEQPFNPPRMLQRSIAQEDLSPDYRPLSQTSSSASSFSYLHSGTKTPLEFSFAYDHKKCPMVQESIVFDPRNPEGDAVQEVFAANVFVPTMRKIFSPVNENEAVGLVIEEEEAEYPDTSSEDNEVTVLTLEENNNEKTPVVEKERLKSQSSSPMTERRPQKYSSFRILPETTNGVVNAPPPFVEEMKLGEELSTSLKMRALQLQKAKEDFLNGRHNSITIIVEDIESNPTSLLVKSASAGIIPADEGDYAAEKKTDTIINLIRKKFKKDGTEASSTTQEEPTDLSHTKSCPSSPVLNPKETTSWIKNPAKKLFRPKGKYTINNK